MERFLIRTLYGTLWACCDNSATLLLSEKRLREVLMALNTTTTKIDGVIVVYLSGAIYFGEESASLRILVKDLLTKSRQIVLDLGDVTYIDSGGLGTLMGLYASARKIGGNIKLARVGRQANEVLRITKVLTLFEVFDKAENAVASFKRASAAS
jgi:anti-sigma B factor antagonist